MDTAIVLLMIYLSMFLVIRGVVGPYIKKQ